MIEAGLNPKNASKLEKAAANIAAGDGYLATGDYVEAVRKYLRAMNG